MRFLIVILLLSACGCAKESVRGYLCIKKNGYFTATFYDNKFNYLDLYLNDGKVRRIVGWRCIGARADLFNDTYIDDTYFIDSVKYY